MTRIPKSARNDMTRQLYAERLSTAFRSARDNFSPQTTDPLRLSERVLAPLRATSTQILQRLVRPALNIPSSNDRYHMVHIQTMPETCLKDTYNLSATYDTIIPRKHLHFDIYHAISKLNAAEDLIHADGFLITSALLEAHLLITLSYLFNQPAIDYETYHTTEPIAEGLDPENPSETIWIDNGNPFYQRFGNPPTLPAWPTPLTRVTTSPPPTNVRLVNEDYATQAIKMLTENLTMFMVHSGEAGDHGRIAFAKFKDTVNGDDELSFETEIWYVPELPKAEVPETKVRKGGRVEADGSSDASFGEDSGRGGKRQKRQKRK